MASVGAFSEAGEEGGGGAASIPLTLDGTGLTTTIPLTIKNGKSESGVELWYTGTTPTAYALMNASGTIKGGVGIATAANDWVTGSAADDIVVFGTSAKKLLIAAKGAAVPGVSIDLSTSGNRVLIDGTGLANVVPIYVNNGKNFSGINLQVTGSAATCYLLRDSAAAHVGGLAVSAGANDWATGVATSDVIVQGKSTGKIWFAATAGGTPPMVLDLSAKTLKFQNAATVLLDSSTSLTAVSLQISGDPNTGLGGIGGADTLGLVAGGVELLRAGPDVIVSPAGALATNATAGFLRLPTCAGPPTGAAANGSAVIDTAGGKLWLRIGGAWVGGTVPGAFV